ncbi:MAG TPA: cytochrome c [Acidimicrobiia bacterium]|nr:cytochrome c [Acidimicrobiia bacterium]
MKRIVIVIATLALLLAACSSGGSTSAATAAPSATTAASGDIDGEAIFTLNCVRCHGADLAGGVGKPLKAGSAAASKSDEELLATITNGVEGTVMPVWSRTLSAEEIAAVLGYIRSVQNS